LPGDTVLFEVTQGSDMSLMTLMWVTLDLGRCRNDIIHLTHVTVSSIAASSVSPCTHDTGQVTVS